MNMLQQLAIVLILIIAAVLGGFFIGERTAKYNLLEAANTAFQLSREVENDVEALTPYDRCLALGGVSNECAVLLRGLDKTTKSK